VRSGSFGYFVVALAETVEALLLLVGATTEIGEALLLLALIGTRSTGVRSASSVAVGLGGRKEIGIGTEIVVALGLIFLGAGGGVVAVEAMEVLTGVDGKTLVIVIGISELETPLLMATS
jgi:hypothetical protein